MIRKFKALGLCLVAVCALGMTATSLAGANPTLTTTNGATIIGHSGTEIVITDSTVTCDTTYAGVAPGAAFTTLTLTPTFANCKAHFPATVNATVSGFGANGCDFLFHSTGTVDLKCAPTNDITITAGTCVVHIPAQDGIGTIIYDTGVAPSGAKDLTLTMSITLKATHTDGFLCPLSGSGTTEAGYVGGITTTARNESGVAIDLTDH